MGGGRSETNSKIEIERCPRPRRKKPQPSTAAAERERERRGGMNQRISSSARQQHRTVSSERLIYIYIFNPCIYPPFTAPAKERLARRQRERNYHLPRLNPIKYKVKCKKGQKKREKTKIEKTKIPCPPIPPKSNQLESRTHAIEVKERKKERKKWRYEKGTPNRQTGRPLSLSLVHS